MYRGRGGYNNNRGGRGGYNNYNNNNPASNLQRANDYVNQNMITVEIQGWDNASQQDLVNFISRKARIVVSNTSVDQSGKLLLGQVRTMRDAQDLTKFSGARFAGQTLFIRIVDNFGLNNNSNFNSNSGSSSSSSNGAKDTIELLKNFLLSCYNPQIKMLDLQNVQNNQILINNGLFSNANTTSKFFPALLKVAQKEKLEIESINLSNNNLDDYTKWLNELALNFPNIKNIALSNNNFKKIDVFDRLKNKFSSLRELIIQGNPLSQDINSMQKLISIFPRLSILDGTPVRDEEKLNNILTFPINSKSMFFENDDLSKAATTFLTSYLNFWDNNRMNLISLYTQQSQFSYQCDSSVIGDYNGNTASNLWNNYTSHSRNLKRVSNEKSRMLRLFIGPEQILNTFNCLPKSKHFLDIKPENYAIETVSFPVMSGMMITIHGDFEEVGQADHQFADITTPNNNNNNKGHSYNRYKNNTHNNNNKKGVLEKRCFDRVFIVVPGANGAFIVASDMLCVKSYSSKKSWNEKGIKNADENQTNTTTNTATNAITNTNPNLINNIPNNNASLQTLPPDIASKLNPVQQELVLKVMQETRLKLEFVLMLCEQSNWDYNTAGQNFINSKSQIPSDAYI
ncbi:nuclear mRNA export, poly(A)+RNA binding protein [Pichia californica]|uniref:Nuclear mRNA export, poly(A)+RNA binding protein n=1 Tax=Pichia californica TaxID=460514 RepID=A0A9P7BFB9_9ASCO|nr:nuclear mRNA export, poly(A)+RNA binding protein [[Candida] californica]KAG0687935.1 nuclear mRNA export, poly(A)+RNA binding protein [[Candida] californica]